MSTRRKPPAKVATPVFKQSAKLAAKTRIDETKTKVSAGRLSQSKSIPAPQTNGQSDSSEDDDEEDEDEGSDGDDAQDMPDAPQDPAPDRPPTTTIISKQSAAEDPSASDSEPQSPTFGELARSRIVDVQSQQQSQQQGLSLVSQNVAPPNVQSLSTVLAQALRTDDTELLESCLQTTQMAVVRATIQRLDSSLAAMLLSRLASRMHRRPGRASTLISWIQWTLISHGGALAAQPDLHRKLSDLNRVLEERARGLNSLLALKGKLDLLEAQMQLRRSSKMAGGAAGRRDGDLGSGFGDRGADDEAGVVYVEGDEDKVNGLAGDVADVDEQFDISVMNGAASDSDEDSDDDEDMDDINEYQRAGAREGPVDDDEVDFDDVDEESGEDDSDVEAAAPPAKVQKTSSATPKRR